MGGMPGADPAQMRQMLGMLRDNPGMMQHMRSALGAMTPEQLQAAVRAPFVLRAYTGTVLGPQYGTVSNNSNTEAASGCVRRRA
jgi:hypothetical protein